MPESSCADTLPAGATGEGERDRVVQVAFNGDSFVGLTASERVAILDPDTQTTRVLWRGRFGALSEDGSVGVSFGPSPTQGVSLEVRSLASDQSLGARAFENGLAKTPMPQTLAVSPAAVVVRQSEAECETCEGVAAPATTVVHWDLATGKLAPGLVDQACGAKAMFSRDGRRFMCVSGDGDHLTWSDLPSGAWPSSHLPGADWRPSRSPKAPDLAAAGMDLSVVEIGSARMANDGRTVYVSYRRSANPDEPNGRAPRRGWRLERWTPSPGEPSSKVQRLADSSEQLCAELLAVSPDGRSFVFGGAHHRVSVRRAPDHADSPLGDATAATSAAFSLDGVWFVTGHADGHLELWDGKTLKSRLTVHPKWRGDE
jgi:WD40 repeat protein